MKKLILGIAAVALAASASFAGDISVGARAAASFGTIWGDDNEDAPWGFGFNAGVDGKIGINNLISVVPEVGVALHRASDDDVTWSSWAIEIPVMARINATPEFFLEVGPSFNFILTGETESEEGPITVTTDYGDDDIDGLNVFEFGIAAGLGYSVLPNLDINFRFALGLTSIIDLDMGYGIKIDDFKNMGFQLGATFWFI